MLCWQWYTYNNCLVLTITKFKTRYVVICPVNSGENTGLDGPGPKLKLSSLHITIVYMILQWYLISPDSPPVLKNLLDALYHTAADKWQVFGAHLHVSVDTLQTIAARHQHDPQHCLEEVLRAWLKEADTSTTWVPITNAVEFLGEEPEEERFWENGARQAADYCTGSYADVCVVTILCRVGEECKTHIVLYICICSFMRNYKFRVYIKLWTSNCKQCFFQGL